MCVGRFGQVDHGYWGEVSHHRGSGDAWKPEKCAKKVRKGKCHKKKVRRNCTTTCAAGAAA